MELECPFSVKKLDSKVVRLVALMVVILSAIGCLTPALGWIALFLAIDFFVRGFTDLSASPLRITGKAVSGLLKLPPKMINAGPKIFAAKIGFGFAVIVVVFAGVGLGKSARALICLLALFAALEAFFNICVGCHLYALFLTLKKGSEKKN